MAALVDVFLSTEGARLAEIGAIEIAHPPSPMTERLTKSGTRRLTTLLEDVPRARRTVTHAANGIRWRSSCAGGRPGGPTGPRVVVPVGTGQEMPDT